MLRPLFLCSLLIGCTLALASIADAKGTVRVQQSDGSNQVYSNVKIQIVGQTLHVTSADGKGTLVISKAACAYQGDLLVCLPYAVDLDQGGQIKTLDFQRGTIYLNLTGAKQNLPLSSTQVPAHGVIGLVSSKKGTLIAISGTIDGQTK